MIMTGIIGEPLETVKGWLQALDAFGSFSPSGDVYLYERAGSGDEPEVGDAWAVLKYRTDGLSVILIPGLDITRAIELSLVRCVSRFTEEAKTALINDVGEILKGLINLDDAAGILSKVVFSTLALDDAAEPVRIGAVFYLSLDLGGR